MNLKWLFNPGCSCAELRERVSLAERGERLLRDEYCREYTERAVWQRTAVINGIHADRAERECAQLRGELAMWKNRALHLEHKAAEGTKRKAAVEKDGCALAEHPLHTVAGLVMAMGEQAPHYTPEEVWQLVMEERTVAAFQMFDPAGLRRLAYRMNGDFYVESHAWKQSMERGDFLRAYDGFTFTKVEGGAQ